MGLPADVGSAYQRRGCDEKIDRLWSEGGDRRVWLRGGPGLGKTFLARRVMREAMARQDDAAEDLLIWVDSADPQAVRHALSSAVDRMPQLGISVGPQVPDRVDRQARMLLEELARSTWRWLIVLDDADAAGLIESALIPPGGNRNGRVLMTTVSRDHRITGHGHVIAAELFTPPEAEALLRAQIDPSSGRPAALSRSSAAHTTALAKAVGYHPLALSIAAATTITNAMEAEDWVKEFNATEAMDAAADARDAGGYPHLIGATWRLALAKASRGLPDGVVERAAMVAAIQDPDGHPTWLWECDDVIRWVAGGSSLARHHGRPVAINRLIEHGFLELRGDTWKQGRLAIHRLAGRAVREVADAANLADLAAILVNQWLLHLTLDEKGTHASLRRNIEPLAALPGLSTPTNEASAALRGLVMPRSALEHAWNAEIQEIMAPYLAKGGPVGQRFLAHQLTTRGDGAADLGRLEEAQTMRTRAAQIYQQLASETASTKIEDRAGDLYDLGRLYQKLGHVDQARGAFTQALAAYETHPNDDDSALHYLAELTGIHEALENTVALALVLERAAKALDARTDHDLLATMEDFDARRRWDMIAEGFRLHRRLDPAARLLALIAEELQKHGSTSWLSASLRKIAGIHAESGRWEEAADVLSRLTTGEDVEPGDLVLLASIQMHRSRVEDARKILTRAASDYRNREHNRETTASKDRSGLRDAAFTVTLNNAARQAEIGGRWSDAAGLYEGLADFQAKRADRDPGTHEHELARAKFGLGLAKLETGQPGEAVEPLADAVKIFEFLTDLTPDDGDAQRELVWALVGLGSAHTELHQMEEGENYRKRAISIVQAIPDPNPDDHKAQNDLDLHLFALGYLSARLGELAEAASLYLRLVRVRLMSATHAPDSVKALRDLASAEYLLGEVDLRLGQPESAQGWLTHAVDDRQELADLDPDDDDAQRELRKALTQLALALARLERLDEAESASTRAVEISRALHESNPHDPGSQRVLGLDLYLHGVLCHAADRLEEAVDHLTGATNVFLMYIDLEPGRPKPQVIEATVLTLTSLAEALRSLGRLDEASTAAERAEALTNRFPDTESSDDD